MRNGLQKINFLILIFIFFISVDIVLAEDVQLGPLINLDEIEPSYESLDETLLENRSYNKSNNNELFLEENELSYVSLSVLNKITANVNDLDKKIKENFNYRELRIYPIDCYLSSPEEKPEIATYLNIYHNSKNEKIFSGWILKSLPSISAIEHPIYDIWVNDCY
mgnify:CR=1 FL=1